MCVFKQWNEKQCTDRSELRALLRYKTLKAELENTEPDLQTLRPSKSEMAMSAGDTVRSDTGSVVPSETSSLIRYVKNGMNPDKSFMQVHYLKVNILIFIIK